MNQRSSSVTKYSNHLSWQESINKFTNSYEYYVKLELLLNTCNNHKCHMFRWRMNLVGIIFKYSWNCSGSTVFFFFWIWKTLFLCTIVNSVVSLMQRSNCQNRNLILRYPPWTETASWYALPTHESKHRKPNEDVL